MSLDVRFHPPAGLAGDHAGHPSGGRKLPLVCPECQEFIQLSPGLCGRRQIDAILLQAERIGAELECRQCGLRFVFHRSTSLPPSPDSRQRRRSFSTV
jgi:hypothetical protein